jgi:hypothetical protein
MMRKAERHTLSARRDELRRLINAWDPIGLLTLGAPSDEYECLVDGILSRLQRNGSAAELAAFLDRHLADHFGVEFIPGVSAEFVARLMASLADSVRGDHRG